jgi:hypothetical protein
LRNIKNLIRKLIWVLIVICLKDRLKEEGENALRLHSAISASYTMGGSKRATGEHSAVLEQRVAGIAEACFEETVLCVLMVCEVRQLCCGGATKEA